MSDTAGNSDSLVISYLALRKVIGLAGIALPLLLAVGGAVVFDLGLQRSISFYYHTGMMAVFVGTLSAIGFFLFSYTGYERADYLAGRLGCLFAVGAALFPTDSGDNGIGFVGGVHYACAAGLFVVLIYFSLVLFTKTDPEHEPTPEKLRRNRVYRACGYTMLACILLVPAYYLYESSFPESPLAQYVPVFWLESLAIWAFGISWLIKGETLLKDTA